MKKLKNFLDAEGRLTRCPAKCKMKFLALLYLAEKFEAGRSYSEAEVNEILSRWHTFGDPATLRRELYDNRFLNRDAACRQYNKEEVQPTLEDLENRYS